MDHDIIVEQLLDRCKCFERTRNEFRGKVVRDNGFWVQGTLRPW
jgi:hypothetical protein